jgi:hypothetical protein
MVSEKRKATGIIIGVLTCLIPALLVGDRAGDPMLWIAIAAIGGAVGGVLGSRVWYAALERRPIAGVGGMLLLAWWASWRSSIYRSEAMLLMLVGALPGLALIGLLGGSRRRETDGGSAQ